MFLRGGPWQKRRDTQTLKTAGHTDFIFVADCKASAKVTRATVDKEKGFYLFPLPMTGKTPEELQTQVINPRPRKPLSRSGQ